MANQSETKHFSFDENQASVDARREEDHAKLVQRRGKKALEIATITMEHPATGRKMILLGVVHASPSKFWESVNTDIAEAEQAGFVIHFEGVRRGTGRLARLSLAKMSVMNKIGAVITRVGVLAGLQWQLDGIKYQAHWENHDSTEADALYSMRVVKLARVWVTLSVLFALRPLRLIFAAKFARYLLENERDLGHSHSFSDLINTVSVVEMRNKIAIGAALRAEGDVLLLWGAGHLPGMFVLLEKAGYVHVQTTWREHLTEKMVERLELKADQLLS